MDTGSNKMRTYTLDVAIEDGRCLIHEKNSEISGDEALLLVGVLESIKLRLLASANKLMVKKEAKKAE